MAQPRYAASPATGPRIRMGAIAPYRTAEKTNHKTQGRRKEGPDEEAGAPGKGGRSGGERCRGTRPESRSGARNKPGDEEKGRGKGTGDSEARGEPNGRR